MWLRGLIGAVSAQEPPQSSCPVKSVSSNPPESKCPVMRKPAAAEQSRCPVKQHKEESEVLDMTNMMPAPNQEPAPGQHASLSTERVNSTIPKVDGATTWEYPSEQMFYNALQRKGKGGGVDEASMGSVVAIHNNMNERAWRQVLEWESMHCDECATPTLARFMGRPDELTPKARLQYMLGLRPRPFDRHDWTVDRCGREVRYVLDYYDVAANRNQDTVPLLHDVNSVPSIEIDVRPALDSPSAAYDRLVMFSRQFRPVPAQSSTTPTPPTPPKSDEGSSPPAADDAAAAAAEGRSSSSSSSSVAAVQERCVERFAAVANCADDRECAQAQISLMACIAEQVCPREHTAFMAMRGSTSSDA